MSTLSLMLPDGDFLRISDPKTRAGQAAWERARDVAIQFAREPSTQAAARLLAVVAEGSDLPGDPRDPDWLPGLRPAQRASALEQLLRVVASWRRTTGQSYEHVTAESGAVSAAKAAQDRAAALRLAALQTGSGRPELLAKAVLAEREAADLAKAAAKRRRRTWGDVILEQALPVGPVAARGKAATAARQTTPAAGDDLLDTPGVLYKRVGGAR